MTITPSQRHYILESLPESGSLEESIVLADLRPKLQWTEEEAELIPDSDSLTIYHLESALEPIEVDLSDRERKVIAQGLLLMEAKRSDDRALPSTQPFAQLVKALKDEIEQIRN